MLLLVKLIKKIKYLTFFLIDAAFNKATMGGGGGVSHHF
jgi:hypothetical protein